MLRVRSYARPLWSIPPLRSIKAPTTLSQKKTKQRTETHLEKAKAKEDVLFEQQSRLDHYYEMTMKVN